MQSSLLVVEITVKFLISSAPRAVDLMPGLILSQFSSFQQRKGWVAAEKL